MKAHHSSVIWFKLILTFLCRDDTFSCYVSLGKVSLRLFRNELATQKPAYKYAAVHRLPGERLSVPAPLLVSRLRGASSEGGSFGKVLAVSRLILSFLLE